MDRGDGQAPTGRVLESVITGVSPVTQEEPAIPGGEASLIGMSDQNLIDAMGRAYGIEKADGGSPHAGGPGVPALDAPMRS